MDHLHQSIESTKVGHEAHNMYKKEDYISPNFAEIKQVVHHTKKWKTFGGYYANKVE